MSKVTYDEMKRFWDEVSNLMLEIPDPISQGGYFEIHAEGKVYRSVGPDEHYRISWVCWEPYHVVHHYSAFQDPDASIRFVKKEA